MSGESCLETSCDMIAFPQIKHQLTNQSRLIPSLPGSLDRQSLILKGTSGANHHQAILGLSQKYMSAATMK